MDSDLDLNPNRHSFPFNRLPDEIQSQILALLPITNLVVCKAVSRSWRSIIRSSAFIDSYPRDLSRRRNDAIFFFFSVSAYLPSCDRWRAVSAYLPSCDRWLRRQHHVLLFSRVFIHGSSLLLVQCSPGAFSILNPFSRDLLLQRLPPILNPPERTHRALALIENNPSDYEILVVSGANHPDSQIYSSRSGRWEPCPTIAWNCGLLDRAVYLDGLLFCLTRHPHRLLTFNQLGRQWSVLDLAKPAPSLIFRRILVFGGEIYLAGCAMENRIITRVGIWKLDRLAKEWSKFSFMPDEYLAEFERSHGLKMVDCMGFICFSSLKPDKPLVYDMAAKRWWWPRPCDVSKNEFRRIGLAIEPYVDLLK